MTSSTIYEMNVPDISTKRPRGRPVKFVRETALDAAVGVFWARGVEGASIDHLTEAMGLNRSSLYQAFGDKRALFFAALDRYQATIGRVPLRELDDLDRSFEASARAFLAAAILNQTTIGRPRGCMLTCVLSDSAGLDEVCRDRLETAFRETDERLKTSASRAQTLGEIDPSADPGQIAFMLSGLMHSLSLRARAGVAAQALTAQARAALDSMFRDLATAR
jgi:AcrR family transcriptional regulator